MNDNWKDRKKGMICDTCMYFVEKKVDAENISDKGRCRKHSPTMTGYPVVFRTDWCGDHKLR